MQHVITGLGNPGEEYENTLHNMGRRIVLRVAKLMEASDWRDDKKLRALMAQGSSDSGEKIVFVLPDNYMNRSGGALVPIVKNKKQAQNLVVVHDDIDLPIGTVRIVFDRGSGGHRGVESIIRALKTSAFVRVRVGTLKTTPSGKVKKPQGTRAVNEFILKPIPHKDEATIKKTVEHSASAVMEIINNGYIRAMQEYNGIVGSKKKKRNK